MNLLLLLSIAKWMLLEEADMWAWPQLPIRKPKQSSIETALLTSINCAKVLMIIRLGKTVFRIDINGFLNKTYNLYLSCAPYDCQDRGPAQCDQIMK